MAKKDKRKKLLSKKQTDVKGFEIPRDVGKLDKLLEVARFDHVHEITEQYLGSGSQSNIIGAVKGSSTSSCRANTDISHILLPKRRSYAEKHSFFTNVPRSTS